VNSGLLAFKIEETAITLIEKANYVINNDVSSILWI